MKTSLLVVTSKFPSPSIAKVSGQINSSSFWATMLWVSITTSPREAFWLIYVQGKNVEWRLHAFFIIVCYHVLSIVPLPYGIPIHCSIIEGLVTHQHPSTNGHFFSHQTDKVTNLASKLFVLEFFLSLPRKYFLLCRIPWPLLSTTCTSTFPWEVWRRDTLHQVWVKSHWRANSMKIARHWFQSCCKLDQGS